MRSHSRFLRRLAPLGLLLASASAGKIQKDDLKVPENYAKHRETVKQMFLDSYGAYKEHAWGHDEVRVRTILATSDYALTCGIRVVFAFSVGDDSHAAGLLRTRLVAGVRASWTRFRQC